MTRPPLAARFAIMQKTPFLDARKGG